MSDKPSFPENQNEALAYLYVKNQDLNGKTPEELCEIYFNAHKKISAKYHELHKEYQKANPRKTILPK